jgi:hypothetical protein
MSVRVAFEGIFLLLLLPAQACRNELQARTTAIAKGLGPAVEQGMLTSRANAPGGVVFDRGGFGRPDAIAVATELGNSGLEAELSSPVIPPKPLRRPFRQNLELNRSAG